MIDRTIEWCSRNRFMVVIAVVGLVLAGAWSLEHIPLDALPDISDIQVIVHTRWMGQPPGVIEDQVTYPIVTTMLAAPRVKAVRAQTMPDDSYVYVVFEDGTDIYWARSEFWSTCNSSVAGCLPGSLPSSGRTLPAPDGSTSTC